MNPKDEGGGRAKRKLLGLGARPLRISRPTNVRLHISRPLENPLNFPFKVRRCGNARLDCLLCNPALCVPVFHVLERALSGASSETRKRGTRFFFAVAFSVRGGIERGSCRTFAYADGAIPSREGRISAVL